MDRNNAEKIIEEANNPANKIATGSTAIKDKNQVPKEVTIAKLGPFKMSLEVKNNEEIGVKSKDHKKHSRPRDEIKKQSVSEKPSTDKSSSKRKRSRSKSEHRGKSEVKSSNSNKTDGGTKSASDNLYEEIKTEAEFLKYEHQISVESKKASRKQQKKDKIVVSKLAKSDRPVREKSPEKLVKVETFKRAEKISEGAEQSQYNASKNESLGKFSRSISQPAGPTESISLSVDQAQNGLKRNLSLIIDEKEKLPRLKRSSTARDSFVNTGTMKHSRSKIVENCLTEDEPPSSSSEKVNLYDNLGIFELDVFFE